MRPIGVLGRETTEESKRAQVLSRSAAKCRERERERDIEREFLGRFPPPTCWTGLPSRE